MEQHRRIKKVYIYGAGGFEDDCYEGKHPAEQYGNKIQRNWKLNLDVDVRLNTWSKTLNPVIHKPYYNNNDVFLVGQPLKFIGVDENDDRMVYLKGLVVSQPAYVGVDMDVMDYKIYNLPESDSPNLLYVHADYVGQRLIVDEIKVL